MQNEKILTTNLTKTTKKKNHPMTDKRSGHSMLCTLVILK